MRCIVSEFNDNKTDNPVTAVFLAKMEAARLRRECLHLVDMRGKVPGVCQKYQFKGRDFYLDDVSYQIFQKGLSEYRGIFTVGTYEAIVNGAHTLKAIRSDSVNSAATAMNSDDKKGAITHPMTIIDFGYYRRRSEDRLEYVTDVILEYDGVRYPAKTRNLSSNGIQLHLAKLPGFVDLEPVYVSFTDLGGEPGLMQRVPFTLMKIEDRSSAMLLSLRRERPSDHDAVGECIAAFIEERRQKYKLDIEDEASFIHAMLYRRLYAESSSRIPLFICRGQDGWRAAMVASNRNNLPILSQFESDPDRYDLTPITLPHRAQLLGKMAMGEIPTVVALLATYRTLPKEQGGQLHSFFNMEMPDQGHFFEMLRYITQFPEYHVYKIDIRAIQLPDQRKIDMFLHELSALSAQQAQSLQAFVETFRGMATVTEITGVVKATCLTRASASGSSFPGGDELRMVWSGAEMLPMSGGKSVRRIPAGEWAHYTNMPFGYVRSRSEDRYRFVSVLECHWKGQAFSARTDDLSVNGLKLVLDQSADIRVGDEVLVSFTELQQHVSGIKLKKIPYTVRNISTSATEIGLERQLAKSREIGDFFTGMIKRNLAKLECDIGDLRVESSARMYECMYAEQNNAISLFIAKEESGVSVIDKIAITDSGTRLARFFSTSEGKPDYNLFVEPRQFGKLLEALTILRRQPYDPRFPKSRQLLIYLYRDLPVTKPASHPVILFDEDLTGVQDKKAFIRQLTLKAEFAVALLNVTPVQMVPDAQLDKIFNPVLQAARHRALKMRDAIKAIQGIVELQDITDIYLS